MGDTFGVIKLDPKTGLKQILIPPVKHQVLLVAQAIGDKLYLEYVDTKEFHNIIKIYDLKGKHLKTTKFSQIDPSWPDTGSLSTFIGANSSINIYLVYNDTLLAPVTVKLNTQTLKFENNRD